MHASSTTDLMQGWGSLASAVFSALAFIVALAVYSHERRVLREGRARDDARQANLILLSTDYSDDGRASAWIHGKVNNQSDARISNVLLALFDSITEEKVAEEFTLSVEPGLGAICSFELPLGDVDEEFRSRLAASTNYRARAMFTDASGLEWIRDGLDSPQLNVISPTLSQRVRWAFKSWRIRRRVGRLRRGRVSA